MTLNTLSTLFVCILGIATDTFTPGDCTPQTPAVVEYNKKQAEKEKLVQEKQESPAPKTTETIGEIK